MSAFEEIEVNVVVLFDYRIERDGARLSWNVFPSTKAVSSQLVVPTGMLFTPLKQRNGLQVLNYPPLTCKTPCRAVLNPYCHVDMNAELWICPVCYQRNHFPAQYRNQNQHPDVVYPELLWENTTIEYVLDGQQNDSMLVLYVVDTALEEQELSALKESLVASISLLAPSTLVGLITFGKQTQVHELGYKPCAKSYVFYGNNDYNSKKVYQMLNIGETFYTQSGKNNQSLPNNTNFGSPRTSRGVIERFFLSLQHYEHVITNAIEQIFMDPWPTKQGMRPYRCGGSALSVAISLADIAKTSQCCRIIFFTGGPSTIGPGIIVGTELKEFMRTHNDIQKDSAKYLKKSSKYYEELSKIASEKGIVVDIFSGSLDQTGLMEMSVLCNRTNGIVVLSDSFSTSIFKQSFMRLLDSKYEGNLGLGYNATLEILTCKDLKVCGLIGPAVSAKRKDNSVSSIAIGISGTSAWRFCSINPSTSVAIYYEVANTQPNQTGSNVIIQLLTSYKLPTGALMLRVTTIARNWGNEDLQMLASSFDQEVSAILVARMAICKANIDTTDEVQKWIDRLLIKLCKRFAGYGKDNPSSFSLPGNFSIYPQFMFHLRRSNFLHVFNSSPDETAYSRHLFDRQDVKNSLLMIQPTLIMYSLDAPPHPVLLDSVSLKPDVVLLLDSFFYILIWHGETVIAWRNSGYQDKPEYESFKHLLEDPVIGAKELLARRFPIPRYIDCDRGGSQERFLISKVNPTTSTNTIQRYGYSPNDGVAITTDDVNLQVFMEHLKRQTVSSA